MTGKRQKTSQESETTETEPGKSSVKEQSGTHARVMACSLCTGVGTKGITMKKLPKRLIKEIHNLPDAVQKGVFLPEVGDQVIIRRDHRIEPITTLLTVLAINKNGLIEMFDDIIGQMFAFNIFQITSPITVKMLSLPVDPVPVKEINDNVTVNDKA